MVVVTPPDEKVLQARMARSDELARSAQKLMHLMGANTVVNIVLLFIVPGFLFTTLVFIVGFGGNHLIYRRIVRMRDEAISLLRRNIAECDSYLAWLDYLQRGKDS